MPCLPRVNPCWASWTEMNQLDPSQRNYQSLGENKGHTVYWELPLEWSWSTAYLRSSTVRPLSSILLCYDHFYSSVPEWREGFIEHRVRKAVFEEKPHFLSRELILVHSQSRWKSTCLSLSHTSCASWVSSQKGHLVCPLSKLSLRGCCLFSQDQQLTFVSLKTIPPPEPSSPSTVQWAFIVPRVVFS